MRLFSRLGSDSRLFLGEVTRVLSSLLGMACLSPVYWMFIIYLIREGRGDLRGDDDLGSTVATCKDIVQGRKGDLGSTGLPGPPGQRGLPGVVGPQGLPGFTGIKGDPGEKGERGLMGPSRGQKGEKGSTGPQGPRGFRGSTGLRGQKGAQGIAGPKGSQGQYGSRGQKGQKGRPASQLSQPAAYLSGNSRGTRSAGYVFQWGTNLEGSFLDKEMTYSGGYIRVPSGGMYYIYGQLACDPNPGLWCGYFINVNGNAISFHYANQNAGNQDILGDQTVAAGFIKKLSSGDRLSVTAATLAYYSNFAYFSYFGAVRLF